MTSFVLLKYGSNYIGSGEMPRQHSLQRWMDQVGQVSPPCAVVDCTRTATDGARVNNTDAGNNKVFMVPMCHNHNILLEKAFSFKPGTLGMELRR